MPVRSPDTSIDSPTPKSRRRRKTVPSSSVLLSRLEQTAEVRAIRDAVVRWPLVSVRAFCDQAANDHEIAAATAILNEAKSAGVLLVDARDPKRAQAVRALVTVGEHTVYDAVQEFTDAVFVLGVVYGLRLGSLGGVR